MKKINPSELIKFLTVGAIGIIPNYIVFNILMYAINYINIMNWYTRNIAWLCGVASGGIFNYIASKNFVFEKA